MPMIHGPRSAARPAARESAARAPQGAPVPANPVVDCAAYLGGRRHTGRFTPRAALDLVREAGEGFVWIGLHEPCERELAGVAVEFGLHPLAVEDAVHAHQRPKLEHYDGTLSTVFKTLRHVEHTESTAAGGIVETGEVTVFTGKDFVITVRHGEHGALGPLRQRLEAEPRSLAEGPSTVLHAIAGQVVDDYLLVAESVRQDIDDMEFDVFSGPGSRPARGGDTAGRIYQLKRDVLEFKRAVTPLLRPVQSLSERPTPVIDAQVREYFRDVADHLVRAHEQVTAFDDLLNSILQANLAQAAVAQNEDMRKITAWAAILAVPTMITGVYGMNFQHMPELRTRYGYYVVLGVTVLVCAVIHRGFRRNGWL